MRCKKVGEGVTREGGLRRHYARERVQTRKEGGKGRNELKERDSTSGGRRASLQDS